MKKTIESYTHTLKGGIRPTPKFAEKRLADYGVNVGLRCGHECTYCSSPALLLMPSGIQRKWSESLRVRIWDYRS